METTIKEVQLRMKGWRFTCPRGDFTFENWSRGLVESTANRHLEGHRFKEQRASVTREKRQALRDNVREVSAN
jgi:hypothetical protein